MAASVDYVGNVACTICWLGIHTVKIYQARSQFFGGLPLIFTCLLP
ncbi:hypothetical protein AB2F00_25165 (plasmid) [Escherichia coli]